MGSLGSDQECWSSLRAQQGLESGLLVNQDGQEWEEGETRSELSENFWKEVGKQVGMGLPAAGTNLLNFLMSLVSIMFVGHLGTLPLAGAAMAATLANVTGFALLEGLASAMETLCGQAFGAEQHRQLGLILLRVQLILCFCCLPIAGVWLNTENILLAAGQNKAIASLAQEYTLYLTPALIGAAFFILLAKFLQSQGCMMPLTVISGIALGFHVLANWLIIFVFNGGFRGAALAFSATDFVQVLLMAAYLKFWDRSGILKRTWPHCTLADLFHHWPSFFALALPAAAMTCFEWWFFEIIIFMSGWLPNPEASIGAMTICFQTAGASYMLPLGLGTAVCVRVSNELGAGRPNGARRSVQVALIVASALSAALALALFLLRSEWALLFAPPSEKELLALLNQLMPSLLMSQLGIGLIAVLAGVLRGSGQQLVGSIVNAVAFYVLALPAAASLAFKPFHYGVQGLWWGLMLGILIQIIVIGILTAMTDWKHQATRAADLLAKGSSCMSHPPDLRNRQHVTPCEIQ